MVRSQAMRSLTIAGLAGAGGVGVETVRYYQRRGLVETPAPAPGSGIRRYGEADVRRLRFIRAAQASGFTLEQIGELLSLNAGRDRSRARALARERIKELDEKIAAMQQAKAALERLIKVCAGGRGPCPIIPVLASSLE
jgi:MerR family mercuric resistance operon transcriptional regulator